MSSVRERIRLRLAELERERGEVVSLRAVSLASGLSEWTLSKLLKKEEHSPTLETIERLALGLETSPIWLAFGVSDCNAASNPDAHASSYAVDVKTSIPVAGLVGAGALVEQIGNPASWRAPSQVELPGVENVEALLVRGESQYPRFFDGDFVLFENRPRSPRELMNQLAIVQTEDGRRLLKIIREAGAGDKWLLESVNAPPETTTLLAAFRYLGVISGRDRAEPKAQKKSRAKQETKRRLIGKIA